VIINHNSEPMPPKPIANSYWVMPGRFLAGEYPGDKDEDKARARVERFVAAGVTLFVDLTGDEWPYLEPYAQHAGPARHWRSHVRDVSVPDEPAQMREILDTIDAALAEPQGVVYVHCWGGVGRTGVVVGCWLARHGHPGQAALDRLRELWRACPKSGSRRSPETLEQEEYIRNWQEVGI